MAMVSWSFPDFTVYMLLTALKCGRQRKLNLAEQAECCKGLAGHSGY